MHGEETKNEPVHPGATGGIGVEIVRQSIERGHMVRRSSVRPTPQGLRSRRLIATGDLLTQ